MEMASSLGKTLLVIQDLIGDESKLLHRQLADPRVLSLASSGNQAMFSLMTFLSIAATVNEVFSTPRSSAQLYQAAHGLASAKATLASRPDKAWRLLQQTRRDLKLTSTNNDNVTD